MIYRIVTVDASWLAFSKFEAAKRDRDGCVNRFMSCIEFIEKKWAPDQVTLAWDAP